MESFFRSVIRRFYSVDRFYDSTHKFPRQSLPHIRRRIAEHL